MRFTPDGRFFVFSLLDYTMKVCYIDSFKLFLSLYGHKLPVLSFDISSDNMLLASGSADKNIRIWGMDFGDIHKSIFAHQVAIFPLTLILLHAGFRNVCAIRSRHPLHVFVLEGRHDQVLGCRHV